MLIDNNLWIFKKLVLNTQAIIFLTTIAGWMNRKQQQVIEYMLEENRVLKQQLDSSGKKLRLNDSQRRMLAKKGKLLGCAGLQKLRIW